MHSLTKLLAAFALSCAAAMPPDDYYKHYRMDLNAVLNSTVCPIVVEMDVDLRRRPQRIKLLKCGRDPLAHCRRVGVPAHECCHLSRSSAVMECQEIQDLMEVTFPDTGETQVYRIPIGCVCVIDQPVMLKEFVP